MDPGSPVFAIDPPWIPSGSPLDPQWITQVSGHTICLYSPLEERKRYSGREPTVLGVKYDLRKLRLAVTEERKADLLE